MVKPIRLLALDIDGVLTDGTADLATEGHEEKRIAFHDLDAVTQARQAGLLLALVTGESSPSVERVAQRFGITQVVSGAKDKVAALSQLAEQWTLTWEEICYVGDGDRDAPALRRVGLGLAPANATPAAQAAAGRVLSRSGGAGAVAEAVRLVLQSQTSAAEVEALVAEIRRIMEDSLAAQQRLLADSPRVLAQVAQALAAAIRHGRKILLFGNGGSAADAQHVAAELVGRFARERDPWAAIALTTDTSILTAVANDWDFTQVFARQVRALARPGDVAVGISTSGDSANVLQGLEAGRAAGAVTIGFTGERGASLAAQCDVCFKAPAQVTARIQEMHLLAWHSICASVEQELTRQELTR